MAVSLLCSLIFLAMIGHSSATYCVCKDGLGDTVYQKNIDYACGNGADCAPIQSNGACYSPSTVKDHCNYAVNSYFQKKAQASGSCDFSASATVTASAPAQTGSCVYPASPSGTTPSPTTPSTTPPSTTTPPPSTTTPTTTPPPPSTTTPTTTPPSTTTPTPPPPSTTTTPVFGLGPTTGTGITTDGSGSVTLHHRTTWFCSSTLTLLFSGLMILRV